MRGYIDAQNASAWHKHWFGGPTRESNSLFFPRPGAGPASPAEMSQLQALGQKYGLGDVADTGEGLTLTSFYPKPERNPTFDKALRKGEFEPFGEARRSRVDSGYVDYTEHWPKGEGSGAATRHMLDYVNRTPEIRDAMNRNPYIAERALAKLERDEDWASKWGAPRQDIQNARAILGQGPGGIDRLEAALKAGTISLPVLAAIFAGGMSALRPASEKS
jgi:hypothetical protein